MRKAFLVLALVAALAIPAAAAARGPGGDATCGGSCLGGGGGWTGCTTQTAARSVGISYVATITHYLVVTYCKLYGRITSLSILAHGCDTGGLVACSTGPAWVTSGGVGQTYANLEAHASWHVTPLALYTGTDVITLSVPSG